LPGERRKLPNIDETAFLEFVKLCFSQKRKTLVNNLKSQMKADLVRGALADLKLRVDARAEQLSVSNLAGIFSQLHVD
jgi:16S rRNA A1518/A1519 N6-dimethyltransferase RsmA/KsgA/DIM1 with predicted DNA glycosylase/AP lyase activity